MEGQVTRYYDISLRLFHEATEKKRGTVHWTALSDLLRATIFQILILLGLKWLPLISFFLLNEMSQAWKGEMKRQNESVLFYRSTKELTPGFLNLFGQHVDDRMPRWLFHVEGVERCIRDA